MKKGFRLFSLVTGMAVIATGLTIMLAGCEMPDNPSRDQDRGSVRFSTDITPGTRADWSTGDEVGMFMIATGSSLSQANIVNDYDNRRYIANSTGAISPAEGNAMFFTPDPVDFVAYYPWRESGPGEEQLTDYTLPVDVTDQSDPRTDILYSNDATAKTKDDSPVQMTFSHALSKLELTIVRGAGAPDLSALSIQLEGIPVTARLSLVDGTSFSGLTIGSIVPSTVSAGSKYEALLIPHNGAPGRRMIFEIGNESYYWNIPDDAAFAQGKRNAYTVTVGNGTVSVTATGILDWKGTSNASITGDTRGLRYKVGDYWPDPAVNFNDAASKALVKGVVVWLDELHPTYDPVAGSGAVGKIVNLGYSKGLWGSTSKKWSDSGVVGLDDEDNGARGSRSMIEALLEADLLSSTYAIFRYIHMTLNENNIDGPWYLPAINEISIIYDLWTNHHGDPDITVNRAWFDKLMTDAGGSKLIDSGDASGYYWSVNEVSAVNVQRIRFLQNGSTSIPHDGYIDNGGKNVARGIKVFAAFEGDGLLKLPEPMSDADGE